MLHYVVSLSIVLLACTEDHEGGSDEVYRTLLGQFQLDQIKITKEYQKLVAEKDVEVGSSVGTILPPHAM